MSTIKAYKRFTYCLLRQYSSKVKAKVTPSEDVLSDIDKEVYKPRNHPGILKPRTVTLPESLLKAIETVTGDHPVKALLEDSYVLNRHLKGKMPPVERPEMRQTLRKVKERVEERFQNFAISSEQDALRYKQSVENRVNNILAKEVYNWKPVNYNDYNSLVYLIGRSAPEYAVMTKIFSEIAVRDSKFRPRSLFDFGSGIGTVTWAAINFWRKSIFEYFNVDSSVHMNDLAQIILQGGKGDRKMDLKGVFFRQFLPATNTTYDLVVSAYSLLELPSRQARLETVLNLWNKTQQYLVIVEQGTYAGFKIVNEVRDFILQTKHKSYRNVGHVFSPCPHDDVCPRFMKNDDTPCNFEINYFTLPIGTSVRKVERYCYVVIKKGERDIADPQWPRVVRETLVRSKHAICRMCTKNAKIEEVIFTTSKHGKTMYHCARSTKWGDLLPISIKEAQNEDDGENRNEIVTDSNT